MSTSNQYPHGDTSWFLRDRFGMFIHWGLYALPGRHEWVKNREKLGDAHYDRYFRHFYPDLYDPADWARRAKRAGMKYFVITTKHHEGFCLWNTACTDYKAPKTPWGKDLLRPALDAFRSEGLRVGFYYSLLDWHHPQFPVDGFHPQRDDPAFREMHKHRDIKKYAAYVRDQVEELLTGYGSVDIMWFDFSYPGEEEGKGREQWESEKLLELVRRLQPNILLNDRLDLPGSADFKTPEQYQPTGPMMDEDGKPVVWEACHTFSGSWGYHRDEATWKSVEQLLWMLIDGVSKGGNLLLNVGPTARGELDYRARERLDGIGDWMRQNGRAIYGCGPAPAELPAPEDCRYTYNAETRRLYLHFFAWPLKTLELKNLNGKLKYAQLLHDGSEMTYKLNQNISSVLLELPVVKPPLAVPVVELFLAEEK
jgi:alpha-L-fucosidase